MVIDEGCGNDNSVSGGGERCGVGGGGGGGGGVIQPGSCTLWRRVATNG